MEAWSPLVDGERAARRAAALLSVLTAGADSELSALCTERASRLRRSYSRLWIGWKALDLKRESRWALNEVKLEIDGAAFKRAREFDLDAWIGTEAPVIRNQAVVGVRVVLALLDSRAPRSERKVANEILSIISKEVVYLDWSL